MILQITIASILALIACIAYFGAWSENESKRIKSVVVLMFITGLFFVVTVILSEENHELRQQLNNKCPEYEKLENVYKLKNNQ